MVRELDSITIKVIPELALRYWGVSPSLAMQSPVSKIRWRGKLFWFTGNISYATRTLEGTQAYVVLLRLLLPLLVSWGLAFLNISVTGFSQVGNIPSLATIIQEKSVFNPLVAHQGYFILFLGLVFRIFL